MRAARERVKVVAGVVGLWMVFLASPALAGVAAIETTAALPDQSEASVKAAVDMAVATAVQGAKAMGLPRIELRGARVLPGAVTVLIIAKDGDAGPLEEMLGGTNYDADDEDDDTPTERPTL